jgi:hypothetical protein
MLGADLPFATCDPPHPFKVYSSSPLVPFAAAFTADAERFFKSIVFSVRL